MPHVHTDCYEHKHQTPVTAQTALTRLKKGNADYVASGAYHGDVSALRRALTTPAQNPYACIISCSDSRSIPEAVFSAGIGDLFVIRVAGNVIDDHQLGSVEYAAEHLDVRLIVVLGHTHCGAVHAAIHHEPDGYVKTITDEVEKAIGEETDEFKAACLNAKHSAQLVETSLEIQELEHDEGLQVIAAVHDIESGKVCFLE